MLEIRPKLYVTLARAGLHWRQVNVDRTSDFRLSISYLPAMSHPQEPGHNLLLT